MRAPAETVRRARRGPGRRTEVPVGDPPADEAVPGVSAMDGYRERMARPLRFDPIMEARRQWIAHGWAVPDWMAATTSITRAQQIILRRIDTALRPLGLTFARYEALVLLSFSRKGSLPLGKMGDRLMVHPASVTNAIDRLEADGLVVRYPHPTDRRTILAEITDAGRALVEQATRALAAIRYGLEGMSGADVRAITTLLTRLRSAAGDFVATGEA